MKVEVTQVGNEFEIHIGARALMRVEQAVIANAKVKDGKISGTVLSVWGATILDHDHATQELRQCGVGGDFRINKMIQVDLSTEFRSQRLYLNNGEAFQFQLNSNG